jgi:hypothetical protein
MNKIKQAAILLLLCTGVFSACKKDVETADPQPAMPVIENMEIGLNNSGIGVIDRDFHFEADVIAGNKIDVVELRILQKAGETYSKSWKHEISWTQYKGAKNTTIHKHFQIPADAAEGKYDLIIVVKDENGAVLEVKKEVQLYTAANMPVDPSLTIFSIFKNGNFVYRLDKANDFTGLKLKNGDTVHSQVAISNVKGDGQMYLLMVNKKENHQPETLKGIDFNKVIVYDKLAHKDVPNTFDFTNVIFNAETFTFERDMPALVIGEKGKWPAGDYEFLILYESTTHPISFFHSIPFKIE